MAIETRPLGSTGFQSSILGYGAMELRGAPRGPEVTDEQAAKVLGAVLDGGINLIDTSVDYGRSEEFIGRHISHRRDEYFLASKCGCLLAGPPPGVNPPPPHDFREANIRAGVEQSLRRLNTDRLDLLQVHMTPSRAQLEAEDTVATMQALRDEGKVRFIGMSGTMPNLADHLQMGVWDVYQIPYSAVQRVHEELISAAAAAGAGVLIRGGAARGALAEDKGWTAAPIGLAEGEGQRRWDASGIEEMLGDMSANEFVLRFTLSHPGLSSTIVGTANPAHLQSNLAVAAKGPLPDDLYQEALRRLGPIDQPA